MNGVHRQAIQLYSTNRMTISSEADYLLYHMAVPTLGSGNNYWAEHFGSAPMAEHPHNVFPCHAVETGKAISLGFLITKNAFSSYGQTLMSIKVMENYRVPFIISPTHWELLGANELLQRFRKKERKNLNATLVTGFNPTTTNRLLPGCSIGRLPTLPRELGNWSDSKRHVSTERYPLFCDILAFRCFL